MAAPFLLAVGHCYIFGLRPDDWHCVFDAIGPMRNPFRWLLISHLMKAGAL